MKTDHAVILKKLLLLFLVISGLYFAKAFLMPVAIGGIIAMLFLPFCKWMEARKVPKSIAVLSSMLVLLLVVAAIGLLLGWQIAALLNDVALIKQTAIEKGTAAQQYIFNNLGIAVEKQTQILNTEKPSLGAMMGLVLSSLKYIAINFILVMVYFFLLLYYRGHIRAFIIKLTAPAQQKEMGQVIYSTTHVAQQYLLGMAKIIVCLWIMYGVGFGIIGVENFIFFAILCGLLEIVPFIGNITGTTLTVFVAAIHGAELPVLGGIVLVYGIVQFIQGWVLEPLILGPQVKINPLFTVIALILGDLVWGIPGIILAIPITAMIKIICDHVDTLKPYGFLIGELVLPKKRPAIHGRITKWFK